MSAAFTTDEIEALRNRAITGLLICAHPEYGSACADRFAFWKGYLNALQNLRSGAGATLANLDAMRSGYETPGNLQTAFATLAERAESATFAEVQQILAAQRVQAASEPIAHGQVKAGQQLEDGVVPVVNVHNEHAPAGVDGDDGAIHGRSPGDPKAANVAQQGGAA